MSGTWRSLTENVNLHGRQPDRPGAKHRPGHHRGRQRRPVEEDHRRGEGRGRRARDTINTMVDQLSSFADEVTRVAREVGTEGKLGGQAEVTGVSGTWKDLTDSVNLMAVNLTDQVRNIAEVTTAVANGDLTHEDHRRRARARSSSSSTRSTRWSTSCRSFADEVTRVAARGGHRGQARRPGARSRASSAPGAASPRT